MQGGGKSDKSGSSAFQNSAITKSSNSNGTLKGHPNQTNSAKMPKAVSPALAIRDQANMNAIDGMKPAGNKGGEKKVAGGVASALAIGVSVDRNPDRRDTGATQGPSGVNDSFNKHYNKELKVSEDEIPLVLLELNESALIYIQKEQYDNALLLLQKAHGVLDVVNLKRCPRDEGISFQVFYNMAMCYQKLGQLEECSLCLETCLEQMKPSSYTSLRDKSLAMRIHKIKLECRLHLQLCAIYSQLHLHKNAYEQAQIGVQLAHLIVRDQLAVCRFFERKSEIFNEKQQQKVAEEQSAKSGKQNLSKKNGKGIDRGKFFQNSKLIPPEISEIYNEVFYEDEDRLLSDLYGEGGEDLGITVDTQSTDSSGDLQTELAFNNEMWQPPSLIERSGKLIYRVYLELLRKIKPIEVSTLSSAQQQVPTLPNKGRSSSRNGAQVRIDTEDAEFAVGQDNDDFDEEMALAEGKSSLSVAHKTKQADMRHILGFLNQSEWVQTLNIGNIMQITPIQLEDLIAIRRNEQELDRFAFLETVSFLCVGYFCVSTEIRFIIQLKEEIGNFQRFDIPEKQAESEMWHTKSLEIACSFLPSDCPLLNHVLLSYQKHHAPSQASIGEDQIQEEGLLMIKPVKGIENCKFRPIIRSLAQVHLNLPLSLIKPASATISKMINELEPAPKLSQNSQHQGVGQQFKMHTAQTPESVQQKSSSQGTTRPRSKIKEKSKLYQQNYQYQQNSGNNTSTNLTKEKLRKILKFDKTLRRFCDMHAVDRKQLLQTLAVGGEKGGNPESSQNQKSQRESTKGSEMHNTNSNATQDRASKNVNNNSNASYADLPPQAPTIVDTGKAAMLAYTNINSKGGNHVQSSSSSSMMGSNSLDNVQSNNQNMMIQVPIGGNQQQNLETTTAGGVQGDRRSSKGSSQSNSQGHQLQHTRNLQGVNVRSEKQSSLTTDQMLLSGEGGGKVIRGNGGATRTQSQLQNGSADNSLFVSKEMMAGGVGSGSQQQIQTAHTRPLSKNKTSAGGVHSGSFTSSSGDVVGKRARSQQKGQKFVDSDSSFFLDGRKQSSGANAGLGVSVHESSFTDQIDERTRIQGVTQQDFHNNSMNELLKKRHHTTDRGSKGQRPRSSKGYRGYASHQASSAAHIPKISGAMNGSRSGGSDMAKSEERVVRTQQHTRPMTQSGSKYGRSQADQHLNSKFGGVVGGSNQGVNNLNNIKLHALPDGGFQTNNFHIHSKSQKPVEFKKIQNLSVKAGGSTVTHHSNLQGQQHQAAQQQLQHQQNVNGHNTTTNNSSQSANQPQQSHSHSSMGGGVQSLQSQKHLINFESLKKTIQKDKISAASQLLSQHSIAHQHHQPINLHQQAQQLSQHRTKKGQSSSNNSGSLSAHPSLNNKQSGNSLSHASGGTHEDHHNVREHQQHHHSSQSAVVKKKQSQALMAARNHKTISIQNSANAQSPIVLPKGAAGGGTSASSVSLGGGGGLVGNSSGGNGGLNNSSMVAGGQQNMSQGQIYAANIRPISSNKLGSAGLHSRRKERVTHIAAASNSSNSNSNQNSSALIDNPEMAMRGFVARSTGGSQAGIEQYANSLGTGQGNSNHLQGGGVNPTSKLVSNLEYRRKSQPMPR